MTSSTTASAPTARTDVVAGRVSPTTGMPLRTIRQRGLFLAAGAASWSVADMVYGFGPTSEIGIKVTDLTGLAFQLGILSLLTVQLGTRATGVRPLSRRLLRVESVLLFVAMAWSVTHALLPGQRGSVWMGVLDAFWPLSMLGMFFIGVKVALKGRWRGRARAWSFLAETWAPISVPSFLVFGHGIGDVVGCVHLLLGYTTLGLILASRPGLVADRG